MHAFLKFNLFLLCKFFNLCCSLTCHHHLIKNDENMKLKVNLLCVSTHAAVTKHVYTFVRHSQNQLFFQNAMYNMQTKHIFM